MTAKPWVNQDFACLQQLSEGLSHNIEEKSLSSVSELPLSSTVIRGAKSQYWRKKSQLCFRATPVFNSYQRGGGVSHNIEEKSLSSVSELLLTQFIHDITHLLLFLYEINKNSAEFKTLSKFILPRKRNYPSSKWIIQSSAWVVRSVIV